MKTLVTLAAAIVAGLAAMVVGAAPALAHTSLIDVQPGEGQMVVEGSVVVLTFSDALLDLGTEMVATDASGVAVALTVERPAAHIVQATLPAMEEGPVTVSWRVVAGDGHPIEGALAYISDGQPSPSPAVEPTVSATAGPAVTVDQETATPTVLPPIDEAPSAGDGGRGVPVAIWIAVGAAVFLSATVGVVAKKRS